MSRFSPPIVHQCPACLSYLARHAVISICMDGETHWTDGFSSGVWTSMHGPVARCPHCRKVFWWEDTKEVCRISWAPRRIWPLARVLLWITGDREGRLRELLEYDAVPNEIKNAARVDTPDFADLLTALEQMPKMDRTREVYLRRRIWWLSNDHVRYPSKDGAASVSCVPFDKAQANKLRLIELFERAPRRRLECGELLRQLGRFDEAIAMLATVKRDGYSEVDAVIIEQLARAGNANLQVLR